MERQQSGGAALPKESDTHCVAVDGQILDGEGTLGQETCHLWLQGARSCGVGGGDLCVARFGDAGDQLSALQVHESDASRPCKNGGEWTSETVLESAAPRALADSACFSGGGCEESGVAAGVLRDETNHAQSLAAIFGRFLEKRVLRRTV